MLRSPSATLWELVTAQSLQAVKRRLPPSMPCTRVYRDTVMVLWKRIDNIIPFNLTESWNFATAYSFLVVAPVSLGVLHLRNLLNKFVCFSTSDLRGLSTITSGVSFLENHPYITNYFTDNNYRLQFINIQKFYWTISNRPTNIKNCLIRKYISKIFIFEIVIGT